MRVDENRQNIMFLKKQTNMHLYMNQKGSDFDDSDQNVFFVENV